MLTFKEALIINRNKWIICVLLLIVSNVPYSYESLCVDLSKYMYDLTDML